MAAVRALRNLLISLAQFFGKMAEWADALGQTKLAKTFLDWGKGALFLAERLKDMRIEMQKGIEHARQLKKEAQENSVFVPPLTAEDEKDAKKKAKKIKKKIKKELENGDEIAAAGVTAAMQFASAFKNALVEGDAMAVIRAGLQAIASVLTATGNPVMAALIGGAAGLFHTGGTVSRAHTGRGIRTNERLVLAQEGEVILSRQQVAALGGPGAAMGLGRSVGGGGRTTIVVQAIDAQSMDDAIRRGSLGRKLADAVRMGRGEFGRTIAGVV